MRLDNYADADTPDGTLRVESDGLSVWTAYSGHEVNGNMAWFSYFEGNICVKNPDEEIRKKMFAIARTLNAKVQGDECELYDEQGNSNWEEVNQQSALPASKGTTKRWWQFWK